MHYSIELPHLKTVKVNFSLVDKVLDAVQGHCVD